MCWAPVFLHACTELGAAFTLNMLWAGRCWNHAIATHAQVCSQPPAQRVLCPDRCQALIERAGCPDQPYSEKHARQQASIVGNMQNFSLTEVKQSVCVGTQLPVYYQDVHLMLLLSLLTPNSSKCAPPECKSTALTS